MTSVRVLQRGMYVEVGSMGRAEWAEEGRMLELTFCLVELGECVLTDVTVPEEHA